MSASEQQIEIPLSKKKLVLLVLGSLMFVCIGVIFLMYPDRFISPIMRSTNVILIAGILSIIFFGLCFFYILKKLGDKTPGLIISDIGIYDNSSGISVGQILWAEIEDIRVQKIHSQKLLMVHVRNPQDFIDKQNNKFKRKMMQYNFNMYGTPISISSNGLKISFDELLSILSTRLTQYK